MRNARTWALLSRMLCLAVLFTLPASSGLVRAGELEQQDFRIAWQRVDGPVSTGEVSRSWIWGPEALSPVIEEPYADSPGGYRLVQYFDKSRMEITHPNTVDPTSPWYETNGLLALELILGNVQFGDSNFEFVGPASIPVAGDPNAPDAPTYSTFSPMYESNLLAAAPREIGSVIDERLTRNAIVREDPDVAAYGVTVAHLDEVTDHAIAAPFWEFMNATGLVEVDGKLIEGPLFQDPLVGAGRPVTEAYWATVPVGGVPRDVLLQCFERRCLTYTPGNPDGFLVETGNVGLHYFNWRYGAPAARTR